MPPAPPPEPRDKHVFRILMEAGRPMRTSEIADAVGIDSRNAIQALTKLLMLSRIQRSKSGGYKAKFGEKERRWRVHPDFAKGSAQQGHGQSGPRTRAAKAGNAASG